MRCLLPQNNSLRALFGAILPSPTAIVPAFEPPGSALEILRSKSPQRSPVKVQQAFECTMWGHYFFFPAVRNTQSDRFWFASKKFWK